MMHTSSLTRIALATLVMVAVTGCETIQSNPKTAIGGGLVGAMSGTCSTSAVSYFDAVQNPYNFYWPLAEVHERLDERMTRAFYGVYEMYKREKINMRQAYLVAVARVAEARKLRGWV